MGTRHVFLGNLTVQVVQTTKSEFKPGQYLESPNIMNDVSQVSKLLVD